MRRRSRRPQPVVEARPRLPWAILVGLLLAVLIVSHAWNDTPGQLTFWDEDEIGYFKLARNWSQLLRLRYWADLKLVWLGDGIRPPLFSLLGGVGMLVFGESPEVALWLQAVPLAVSLFALMDLVSRLHGSDREGPWWGLLAAALWLLMPVPALFMRTLMMELPLASVVIATLWFLVRARPFSRPVDAVILGLLCGLGLLTKWTFPVFVGGGLLTSAWQRGGASPSGPARGRVRALLMGGLAAAVCLAVAALWYVPAWETATGWLRSVSVGDTASTFGGATRTRWESWGYYPVTLLGFGLGLPFALAQLPALRGLRRLPGSVLPVAVSAVLPVLAFGLLSNKEIRYLVPALALWAAVLSLAWARTRAGEGRDLRLALALVVGALQLMLWSSSRGFYPRLGEEREAALTPWVMATWSQGALFPELPTRLYLRTVLGEVELLTRRNSIWEGREWIRDTYGIEDLADQVRAELRADSLEFAHPVVAVVPWETELWASLWLSLNREDYRYDVDTAACNSSLVDQAEIIVTMEPHRPLPTCQGELDAAEERFRALRPTLRPLFSRELPEGNVLVAWRRLSGDELEELAVDAATLDTELEDLLDPYQRPGRRSPWQPWRQGWFSESPAWRARPDRPRPASSR